MSQSAENSTTFETLTIVGAGVHNDKNYKHRSGGITLVISAPEPEEPPAKPPVAAAPAPAPTGTK